MIYRSKSTKRYYIGIDPGVKTGYAVWDALSKRMLVVDSNQMLKVMNFIIQLVNDRNKYFLIIEDARKRKYFRGENMSAKAQGAGSVKRDCQLWEEFCTMYKFNAHFRKPRNTKVSSEQFHKMTKWEKQTNSHSRDAAMIVFGI